MTAKTIFDLFNSTTREDVIACIDSGIDINVVDCIGQNALFGCKSTEAVDAMTEAGINVNHLNRHGDNALFYAVNPLVLQHLINKGMDIHHKNHAGQNCLFHLYFLPECCEILLNAGININETDNQGQNILHCMTSLTAFNYWVQVGCNINHRDKLDRSVLDLYRPHWQGNDFKIHALMHHADLKDTSPVVFYYLSPESLPLMAFLREKGISFTINNDCTVDLQVKDMRTFFTGLRKYTDIRHINFLDTFNIPVSLCAGAETVKWFIRNGIRTDENTLREHSRASDILAYKTRREEKYLRSEIQPATVRKTQKKRL